MPVRLVGVPSLRMSTSSYSWGSYEADASLTIVNVTAAVSDRSRAKRPPRLIAYAYAQRRAGTGVAGVTRHYKPLRHVTFSRVGCPQLKNYYSPIWIAMRWYKARAFMRHHKTPGAASAPAPIKHRGLIPFSSKLVIQHLPSFFCTLVPRMPV